MNKYFKTNSVTYETIRDNMDKASGYPSNEAETWFAPVADAPMDDQGNVLILQCPRLLLNSFLQELLKSLKKNYKVFFQLLQKSFNSHCTFNSEGPKALRSFCLCRQFLKYLHDSQAC